MAKQPLIMRVAVPDEYVVDDGTGHVVVSVQCQGERHQVRLTSRGQLGFDHHDDLSTLALAGEVAALAKEPQTIRCAEILLVWRHWRDMATHFPGAPRAFGLPTIFLAARTQAHRLREDRAKYRDLVRADDAYRLRRERAAFMNRFYQWQREQLGQLPSWEPR
jgi:hypothetical protein